MAQPRKFATATDRVQAQRQRLADAGGAIVQVRLTAEAVAALDELTKSGGTKSAAINSLLIASISRS